MLTPPNVDLQQAAVVAIGVAQTAKSGKLAAQIAALATLGHTGAQVADVVILFAHCAWYVRHRVERAMAVASEAMVPVALVDAATSTRVRMLRCAEYHLGQHPVAGPHIEAVRAGQGYQDLANDLVSLADLYDAHESELSHDRRNYRREDAAAARSLAGQIVGALAASSTAAADPWLELQARAWRALLDTYEQLRRAGTYLCPDDAASLFPSLVTAGRGRSSRRGAMPEAPAAQTAATPVDAAPPGGKTNGASVPPPA